MQHHTQAIQDGQSTTELIGTTTASRAIKRDPVFIRLPKTGTLCPYSALTRSKLNELILPCPANNFAPPVRSVVVCRNGKTRGVRLISFRSLMDYLNAPNTEVRP